MNRSLSIRGAIVLAVLLFSIWGLIPTFRAWSISEAERDAARNDPERLAEIQSIDEKAIRQGLDLRGGMYLVLEVDTKGMSAEQARDALQRVREIIANRVDQFGVSEPVIQTQGRSRIVVQLPGLQDVERARRLIGTTAQLEFRLVRGDEEIAAALERLDAAFRSAERDSAVTEETAPGAADTASAGAAAETPAPVDTLAAAGEDTAAVPYAELPETAAEEDERLAEFRQQRPFSVYILADPQLGLLVEDHYVAKVQQLLASPPARVLPNDVEFLFGMETLRAPDGTELRPLYLVDAKPSLTGEHLTSAQAIADPEVPGNWQVSFALDRRGAAIFSRVTGENVGRRLAICLDKRVKSAPTIQSRIRNNGSITGRFSLEQAQDLALLLRAGALPTDVHIEEERSVGPSLGRDSIHQGVSAAIYGSLFVIAFILVYYRMSGFVTVAALVSNILILLAVLAQFGLVLTLPGIAGIILTVGMAVDANVLINERIREELRRDKTVKAAVESGYRNATRTIVDANVTTLIAGGILLYFGTGPIKGFAVTLSIGIISSMFTALVLTRVLMELMTRKQGRTKVSI
jgi:protein-export membrane protein SecD